MNLKKVLFTALLTAGCFTASAQKVEYVDGFNHHWFVQAQGGGQYTLGELKFKDLLSPNVQVAVGYQFTPVWGLRLAANGWQSKAGSKLTSGKYDWKWKYVSPTLDATLDLTNLIGGYKKRVVNAGLLAGLGANIGWDNDEAIEVSETMHGLPYGEDVGYLEYLWDGTKARFTGRVGAFLDFHVCKRVDLGFEVNANTLSDHYNSKDADNLDWYFNALAGIKIRLGKVTKKVAVEAPCQTIIEKVIEKPVEKVVEKVVYKEPEAKPEVREQLRRDIFFVIRGSEVSKAEMSKIEDIVNYMKKYPESKVNITAYADKGTGNPKVNKMYSERRAKVVYDLLTTKYGISPSRISTQAKGDTEQPYAENDKNRVSICIAE